jgi:hypothetical protein
MSIHLAFQCSVYDVLQQRCKSTILTKQRLAGLYLFDRSGANVPPVSLSNVPSIAVSNVPPVLAWKKLTP